MVGVGSRKRKDKLITLPILKAYDSFGLDLPLPLATRCGGVYCGNVPANLVLFQDGYLLSFGYT